MTVETKAPLITIGLGVYNGERRVGDAIESLLAQSFRGFMLLISDNCSTDRTYEICSRYAARDERIELVRTARNLGAVENFPAAVVALLHDLYLRGGALGAEVMELLFHGRTLREGEAIYFALLDAKPEPRVVAFVDKLRTA